MIDGVVLRIELLFLSDHLLLHSKRSMRRGYLRDRRTKGISGAADGPKECPLFILLSTGQLRCLRRLLSRY